jgi:hypothetical protein
MWNDPAKIAAMEAAKNEAPPAPAGPPLHPLVLALLAEVDRRAETSLRKRTYARVMHALVPIFSEMRAKRHLDSKAETEALFDMVQGMIEGLGFGIATLLTYVPPAHADDALRLLFREANRCGFDISFGDEEPKK